MEPQAFWMGMATVESRTVSEDSRTGKKKSISGGRVRRTDGDAEAVKTDEVLAAVAAGDLLAVAALVVAGLGVDVDLGVLVGSTALGESNGGHGGDDERLEEGHFVGLGWFGKGWWEASVVIGLELIGLLDDGEKLVLRRWRTRYLYASVCQVGVHCCPSSPETETVCVVALACGVGVIALGACVMAMPIVERPSCLTRPGAWVALVLLSLLPWSRFRDGFETGNEYTDAWPSTLSIFPAFSSHILVKMLPFSSAIAQFFMVLQGW